MPRTIDFSSTDVLYPELGRIKLGITSTVTAGIKGDKGDKGEPGIAGVKGLKGDTGVVGPAGPASGQLSIVAIEDIPAFSPVTSKGKIADSSNVSQTLGKVIGISLASIAAGFSGSVAESGEVTNPLWSWAIGDIIFLNGTALSNSAPSTGFVQIIGTAKGPTIIVVELGTPFTF